MVKSKTSKNKSKRSMKTQIIEEAIEAYINQATENGYIPIQPSLNLSDVWGACVTLRNGFNLLAKYNHHKKAFIEFNEDCLQPKQG